MSGATPCLQGFPTDPQSVGSIPNSYHAEIRQQRLWHSSFASVSLTIAASDFDRSPSPNFRLTMLNVDSTLLRLW